MVNTSTFISDTVKYIRNELDTNITDPISSLRTGRERFVMTSYPQRGVKYPLITVKVVDMDVPIKLGLQSELHQATITLEIRIWARDIKEKDELTEQIMNRLRGNQLGSGSAQVSESLHDWAVLSFIDVDEPGNGPKSKVMQIKYMFIYGS